MKLCARTPKPPARQRLLDAAVKVFALHGYEGASTRMLVKEAGVNISAIPYYFGGKEGLYHAVIEHLAAMSQNEVAARVEKFRATLADPALTDAECLAILHRFVTDVGRFMLGDRISPHAVRIMLREQSDPSPVFGVIYEKIMRPLHETLTAVVARLSGLPPKSEEAILCAHSLIGQMAVFKTHRALLLRRTGWQAYDEKNIEKIIATVLPQIDAILAAHRGKTGDNT